jgi:hydroxymethylbilane synthase
MNASLTTLRFGTRGSALARWQTEHVQRLLAEAHPALVLETEIFSTKGDRVLDAPLPEVGGKGLFTEELEAALRDGRIDCAVHSLKDLPVEPPVSLIIAAIPRRAAPHDVLVSRGGHTLESLPPGATVGTSSLRRAAQLLHLRPDLRIANVRGNVDTRVRKALDPNGEYDAIVLAQAGVERLGLLRHVRQVLALDAMLPAPGQGAIAVQARTDATLAALLQPIHHAETALAVAAERAFLAGLGGGCAVPVAAFAHVDGDRLHLRCRVSALDGTEQVDVAGSALRADEEAARALGARLAGDALAAGARALVEQAVP